MSEAGIEYDADHMSLDWDCSMASHSSLSVSSLQDSQRTFDC